MRKTRFYWARIGDGNYEPVAVIGRKGARMAYTIGCQDPFSVDEDNPAIVVLEKSENAYDGGQMTAPLTPKQEAAADRRERRYREIAAQHRYAGFGRTPWPADGDER